MRFSLRRRLVWSGIEAETKMRIEILTRLWIETKVEMYEEIYNHIRVQLEMGSVVSCLCSADRRKPLREHDDSLDPSPHAETSRRKIISDDRDYALLQIYNSSCS